jgi:hypothetical protein
LVAWKEKAQGFFDKDREIKKMLAKYIEKCMLVQAHENLLLVRHMSLSGAFTTSKLTSQSILKFGNSKNQEKNLTTVQNILEYT